jgi:Uma2 family endonuclease
MDQVEEPITDYAQLDPEKIYTYADYLKWKFQERVELIRGKIFKMSPAPNTAHQRISIFFSTRFFNFFEKKPCQVFAAPFDVRLPVSRKKGQDTTVVQPDLCVICDEKKLDQKGCAGAPDLVIEILSPGNSRKEMREKFEVYEEAGVREYWIVDPERESVISYVLNKQGKYIGLPPKTAGQRMAPAIFPELQIDLGEVFRE